MSKRTRSAAGLVAALALAACASDPGTRPSGEGDGGAPDGAAASSEPAGRRIAADFANAIVQSIGPAEAPLRFARDGQGEAPVLEELRRMLGDAGYAIRRVADSAAAAPGERVVRHSVVAVGAGASAADRHEIAIGDVRFRRAYRRAGARVVPASGLFVRGLDEVSIRTADDALFGAPPPVGPGGEMRVAIDPAAIGVGVAGDGGAAGLDVGAGLGDANGGGPDGSLATVVEHELTFRPGSHRLDRGDVALIDDVLDRFDPRTDVITVVGASVDPSIGLEDNRVQALERAARVRDAFTAVGVPDDRVLIEGYWSDAPGEAPAHRASLRLARDPG